jgi:putative nucleotidyltransferase with HDIG domain
MYVDFITDDFPKVASVRAMLGNRHVVIPRLLGSGDTEIRENCSVLMFDADLRKLVSIQNIKQVLQKLNVIPDRLFVVPKHIYHLVAQALALGATAIVSRPREIVGELAQIEAAKRAALAGATPAATGPATSTAAFASMFSALRNGQPVSILDAETVTMQIIHGIETKGLGAWLEDVRRHHQGTFQHCLLVTGLAVGFSSALRFGERDVKRLGMAATLHDIGKANIPLSILDKPGRLDPDEEAVMRTHPVLGYEALRSNPDVTAELLDCVRHHHEFLDGSGYPDGLKGQEISDLTRLLTISDIFTALIERRSYKPPLSCQDAYKILCSMEGKLEGALVRAFGKVALAL